MAIQKISKEDINFDHIYGTKSDAQKHQNNVKVNEIYWGDNGDLYYDDQTGLVTENGVGLGFINIDDITSNAQDVSSTNGSMYDGSFREDSDIMKQSAKPEIESISEEGEEGMSSEIVGSNDESMAVAENAEGIENIETNEETVEETPVEQPTAPEEAPTEGIENIEANEEIVEETPVEQPTAPEEAPTEEIKDIETDEEIVEEEAEEQITPIVPGEQAPTDSGVGSGSRNIEQIKSEVDKYGGNGGHSIENDAKNSGNEAAYMENMNNLLDRLARVEQQFAADGKGISFQSSVFSGGTHATGSGSPSHKMGAKVDLKWFKDGDRLTEGISQEDRMYIKSVLQANNLDVQFESYSGSSNLWGDVYLDQALNQNGEYVTYSNSDWGSGTDITNV